jgi:simple sugar transport system ATP-binding protein
MNETVLELTKIVKRFPGLIANDNVDFDLKKGEVHALLGENGAGKSTLMNIVYGIYKADSGDVKVNGEKIEISSPRKAIEYGIGMIQQHFSLVPSFDVTQNVALGLKDLGIIPDLSRVKKQIMEISKRYKISVDPDAKIWQISAGEQQRVEIIKLLYVKSQIMILDEPTAILTPQEANGLFETIREMTKNGASVIFISHKLKEVLAISDRVTVLRHGKVIGSVKTNETNENELAKMMVGREVILKIEKKTSEITGDILKVKDLRVMNDKGLEAVKGLNFEVRGGEILGIAGVEGNGQKELAEALYGMRTYSGSVTVNGAQMRSGKVMDRIKHHVAYIPQDRKADALCGGLPIYENLFIKAFSSPSMSFNPYFFVPERLRLPSLRFIKDYSISASSVDLEVKFLSGGTMQKVVLAREIGNSSPKLIIAVHPTRGLDVGAEEFVYNVLMDQKARGAAILLIAGDLFEIFNLSDRVAVLYEGQIIGYSQPDESHLEEIGLMMAGVKNENTF